MRAAIPVAYSAGFNPRPRMALAAPLPVGVTSECELMDIYLVRELTLTAFRNRILPQLPTGLGLLQVEEVPLDLPSLQARVWGIGYRVTLEANLSRAEIEEAVRKMLHARHFPWRQMRDDVLTEYDLRPLVQDITVIDYKGKYCILGMQLLVTGHGTGRPEQVALALGFPASPCQIHRVRLSLAHEEVAISKTTEENIIG